MLGNKRLVETQALVACHVLLGDLQGGQGGLEDRVGDGYRAVEEFSRAHHFADQPDAVGFTASIVLSVKQRSRAMPEPTIKRSGV